MFGLGLQELIIILIIVCVLIVPQIFYLRTLWRSRVPQNVIHGFRTVLADIGANVGYIVSMAGPAL